MTSTTVMAALLTLAAVIVTANATRLALAGVRARRRTAWEPDRAEWRR